MNGCLCEDDLCHLSAQLESKLNHMIEYSHEFIQSEIMKAYIFARDAHHGDIRLSGEPYINHPVESTLILLSLKPDIFTIQACLLHDVIEDTPKTHQDIVNNF